MSPPSKPDDLTPLLETLRGGHTAEREAAIWALAALGERAVPALPDLIPLLGASPVALREETARALAHIGRPAVPALVDALRGGAPDFRKAVLVTLATLGPDAADAEPELRALLEDEWLGPWATEALARIHEPRPADQKAWKVGVIALLFVVPLVAACLFWLAAHVLVGAGFPRLAVTAGLALAVIGASMGPVLGYRSWSASKTFALTVLLGLGGGIAGLVLGGLLGGLVEPLTRVLQR